LPDTNTPNLNLTQPQVGASDDTWGTKINADLAIIDALFATSGAGTAIVRAADNTALTSGVTITGPVTVARVVQFMTSGVLRWLCGADNVAESGGNVGADFVIQRYSDAGSFLGTSIAIARSTGAAFFETTPFVGSNVLITSATMEAGPGVGEVRMWEGTSDPPTTASGQVWIIADGRFLSRTAFPAYFSRVGTRHSAGDGFTTFGVLNMKGFVPVGYDAAAAVTPNTNVLGGLIGESAHTLTQAELPAHKHAATISDPTHVHSQAGNTVVGTGGTAGFTVGGSAGFGGTTGAAATGVTLQDGLGNTNVTQNTGGGGAHNNIQPSAVINFIVRVA
jgi:microcystin-dependent protein